MRNRFDRQLEQLNEDLIQMGNLIEQAIELAVSALARRDVETAKKAIEFDAEIDRMERTIEDLCLRLLLQQQPVAKDLRLISAALKMITDMERIGDQAADISEITIMLADVEDIKGLAKIEQMAKETTIMVVKAIEAFVNRDIELVTYVIERDDVVDKLFDDIKKEIAGIMNANPEYGEQAIDFLMIGKYFERIGDHATNIAEWVIFSITGNHDIEA